MTIAITGATGQLGRLDINQLKDQVPAADLVALVRSPAKASDLGVSAREADYSKPEILDQALAGVNTLLLISSSEVGQRAVQHHNVIAATKNQGVKRIVYTSLLHADTSALSLANEHRETEAELKASGLLFTILRNGWYSENYTASVPSAVTGGAFLGSADDVPRPVENRPSETSLAQKEERVSPDDIARQAQPTHALHPRHGAHHHG
jgi:NAD(P)H dehydrogenase (quinone)